MGWANFGVDLHLELIAAGGRRAGLESALREAIRAGRLMPGTRLPSTRDLAIELADRLATRQAPRTNSSRLRGT